MFNVPFQPPRQTKWLIVSLGDSKAPVTNHLRLVVGHESKNIIVEFEKIYVLCAIIFRITFLKCVLRGIRLFLYGEGRVERFWLFGFDTSRVYLRA